MAQVEFNYNGTSTVIQCQEVQNMDEIFNNFLSKTHLDKNKINLRKLLMHLPRECKIYKLEMMIGNHRKKD